MKTDLQCWLVYLLCVLKVKNVLCSVVYNTIAPAKLTRATQFVPRVIAKTCYLKPDRGPCRSNIWMYYFNPNTMNCETFEWGGCQGNGNRFDTIQECKSNCVTSEGRRRPKPKWCQLAFDYGFCFGAVERWYYDRLWKVCKKTIYSGCGGNKNNFYNKEQCDQICRFGKKPLGSTTSSDGLKKVIIINPWDATTKRRGNQDSNVTHDGSEATSTQNGASEPTTLRTPEAHKNGI